ncbi:cytochrome c biogenesis CcdA family protein [Sneathiella aquimaris]|jgi:cytochrome c-type biogenesis protein|uniref:cytochrome c biogenesis CcdA family protein n=1 Tax=Sneathiella aquimaris TaxID=2599305 RepID=UPI00146D88FB|nr:cytochrome c biogenesis protein CcdA [Sneathiella aquimaris]
MEFTLLELVLLPIGLGLLGFVEPCTIGGHLLFLETQNGRSNRQKLNAVLTFVATRSLIAGLFGALIAFLGQKVIAAQTGIWLIFGLIYLAVGIAFLIGRARFIKQRINLAPAAWKQAQNPFVLGLAFGLNIPACAAPILFGLLGLAASTGTVMTGFGMMFLFGLFLSSPLAVFALVPTLAKSLENLGERMKRMRWLIGLIFTLLGLWSIWFGLYVDPANWAGR